MRGYPWLAVRGIVSLVVVVAVSTALLAGDSDWPGIMSRESAEAAIDFLRSGDHAQDADGAGVAWMILAGKQVVVMNDALRDEIDQALRESGPRRIRAFVILQSYHHHVPDFEPRLLDLLEDVETAGLSIELLAHSHQRVPALPEVVAARERFAEHPSIRAAANRTIGGLNGTMHVELLVEDLHHEETMVVASAIRGIAKLTPHREAWGRAVVEVLADPDDRVLAAAVENSEGLNLEDETLKTLLTEAMANDNANIRQSAVLAARGLSAQSLDTALIQSVLGEAVDGGDFFARQAAEDTLRILAYRKPRAAIALLGEADGMERRRIAETVASSSRRNAELAVESTKELSEFHLVDAIHGVGQSKWHREVVVPFLLSHARGEDIQVALAALDNLRRSDAAMETVAPMLSRLIAEPERPLRVRIAAVETAKRINARTDEVRDAVKQTADASQPERLQSVARAFIDGWEQSD